MGEEDLTGAMDIHTFYLAFEQVILLFGGGVTGEGVCG